ncbi:crotonase/enoyl-CoA hydratase family protein [Dietzia kunjamensis]|uniref:crotonase/enoyl-CoA hydratase family protein n=1 Tax=Dietzia kunjamensis TaxID=322509 RepID=UPI002DBFEC50|nr:crotonase/enoyl-CoA hydratase family protein [Dietzia kunjamensis]MEB8326573.1 crotonase/enoyl-CoA hydratase family protein [Dietzia kunjamensis]
MTATESRPAVLTERRNHILLVTISRPEARNAVNAEVSTLMGRALHEAEADPEVRAVVITGAGEKSFCAGADLKAFARGEDIFPVGNRQWGFAGMQQALSVPLIAAVNGSALGGGCEIALACDLVVAADHAIFGLPEVTRGLVATAGGAFRLPAQIPHRVAMEMILTGEPISAARALDLNLVNRVVPPGELLETALKLAETITANAPLAVQGSKRIALGIVSGARPSEDHKWSVNDAEMVAVMNSQDAAEGARAFAEKRSPAWRAR